jgi:hypothetical protein
VEYALIFPCPVGAYGVRIPCRENKISFSTLRDDAHARDARMRLGIVFLHARKRNDQLEEATFLGIIHSEKERSLWTTY